MKPVVYYLIVFALSCSMLPCSTPSPTSGDQAKPAPVGDYQYTGYDKKGTKIVEGRLSISRVETRRIGNEDTIQIKGNWQLNKVGDPERIGAQTGSGDLIGSIINGELHIDLNPNINDGNVILVGTIEGKRFHGKWSLKGVAGTINEGAFEALKK